METKMSTAPVPSTDSSHANKELILEKTYNNMNTKLARTKTWAAAYPAAGDRRSRRNHLLTRAPSLLPAGSSPAARPSFCLLPAGG